MTIHTRRIQRLPRTAPPPQQVDVTEIMDVLRDSNTLLRLILGEVAEKRVTGVLQLMYPDDGTKAALAAGTTEINYMAGTVIATDGTVTKMSASLNRRGKDCMEVLAILADEDVVVQLDSHDRFLIDANTWFEIDEVGFTSIRITTTVLTNVIAQATSGE